MKNGLVIADAGPVFSLAILDKLKLLDQLFEEIRIPRAVWREITLHQNTDIYDGIVKFFEHKVIDIHGFNELTFLMDYGESQAVILYKELGADFLLIDDKKAREIAENFGMNCIGTLGLLSFSKDKDLIRELRPLFIELLNNKRYFSLNLLNAILIEKNEEPIIH